MNIFAHFSDSDVVKRISGMLYGYLTFITNNFKYMNYSGFGENSPQFWSLSVTKLTYEILPVISLKCFML